MKAIVVLEEDGRPLRWQEVADPDYGPDEALVEVYAAGLNRADLAQRAGNYPPPIGASEILGLEVAGRIVALGENVGGWSGGDRVAALLAGGGYAERVSVPADMLMPVPEGWSYVEAAAVPEVFLTAFLNLFLEAVLKEGEAVLIHGGASGVGTAAVQLAREAGCRVFATAGTDEKVQVCRALGAEIAVNYRNEDFAEVMGPDSVDVVLDMVGRDYLARNLEVLKTAGRLVFIATLSGSRAEIDIRTLMAKRLMLKGSTLRARPLHEKVTMLRGFMDRFWPLFLARKIKPVIDSVVPIAEAERAHARMRENKNIGKIVLEVKATG
jgi:putative PIG3 family NAD(P)H quinone oxidoreductase